MDNYYVNNNGVGSSWDDAYTTELTIDQKISFRNRKFKHLGLLGQIEKELGLEGEYIESGRGEYQKINFKITDQPDISIVIVNGNEYEIKTSYESFLFISKKRMMKKIKEVVAYGKRLEEQRRNDVENRKLQKVFRYIESERLDWFDTSHPQKDR